MDWEKILANSVINKGLVSKQTAHIAQYQKNSKQPNQKMDRDLNRHFFKEDR